MADLLLPSSTSYAFWWGNPADFPADAQTGLDQLLTSLNGSSYLSIADQYMQGANATTRFSGNLYDSSTPPSKTLPDAKAFSEFRFDIGVHLYQFLIANGLTPDPNGIYFIFTSNYAPNPFVCGFHDALASGTRVLFQYAYVPNQTSNYRCLSEGEEHLADPYLAPNNYSAGTHAMVDDTAHEFMEMITDPTFAGWYDVNGNEIGDACGDVFQSWVELTNTSRWKIQEIWSNQVNGCVQGDGSPVQLLGATSNFRTVTTFNIPGTTYGIFGNGINSGGTIAGTYYDANFFLPSAGFVRDPLGNTTTFNVPGATTTGTVTRGINSNGTIAGAYDDASGTHGFVRDPLGNITTFDVPAGVNGTEALSINNYGAVAGYYSDASFVKHGFVRTPSGVFVTFDAPGAVYGTIAHSINNYGAVAGYYSDSNGISHGFVRDQYGNFTTLSDIPWSMNDNAATTGYAVVKAK